MDCSVEMWTTVYVYIFINSIISCMCRLNILQKIPLTFAQNLCTFYVPVDIQVQKEQYLAYRKVFHNDDTDVFEKRRREVLEKAKLPRMSQPVGPSPFAGLSNYAAMMLTQAMQAPQQAQQQQPPTGN